MTLDCGKRLFDLEQVEGSTFSLLIVCRSVGWRQGATGPAETARAEQRER
jgi:hypothetical protein